MKPRISILVVDDLEMKRRAVQSALSTKLKYFDLSFEFADRYEEARTKLQSLSFDFVILDIKIPAGSELASEKWSRQLLRDILDGKLCYPMHVFGLTEHKEIAHAERQFYEANMFGFFIFEWDNEGWADAIANKIQYLALALQNGAAYRLNSFDYDVLIVTARYNSEFEPVKRTLFGKSRGTGHRLWPDQAHFGQLSVAPGHRIRAALICIGQTGLAQSALVTGQAIQILRPRIVAMLGMCAGFESKDVKVMDVLVAREAACWQEGKMVEKDTGEEFDLRSKTRTWSAEFGAQIEAQLEMQSSQFKRLCEEFSRRKEYLELRKRFSEAVSEEPKVRAGLVVSGSSVVASNETAAEILRLHRGALGLEMEIYSVYTAADRSLGKRCEFVAVKGVADFADRKKRDDTQPLASELSALVFKVFLSKWFTSRG